MIEGSMSQVSKENRRDMMIDKSISNANFPQFACSKRQQNILLKSCVATSLIVTSFAIRCTTEMITECLLGSRANNLI